LAIFAAARRSSCAMPAELVRRWMQSSRPPEPAASDAAERFRFHLPPWLVRSFAFKPPEAAAIFAFLPHFLHHNMFSAADTPHAERLRD